MLITLSQVENRTREIINVCMLQVLYIFASQLNDDKFNKHEMVSHHLVKSIHINEVFIKNSLLSLIELI